MRIIPLCLAATTAIGLAGCATTPEQRAAGIGTAPRPAYYVPAPRPGERRCVEIGEDMYGRPYCARFHGS